MRVPAGELWTLGSAATPRTMTEILQALEFGSTNADQIAAFERALGRALPDGYRAFLLEYNGGIPSPDRFLLPFGGDPWTIECLFGLHDGPPATNLRCMDQWPQELLRRYLPIGYEQGGNPICLDLLDSSEARVVVWDQAADQLAGVRGPESVYEVGSSFEKFLQNLV